MTAKSFFNVGPPKEDLFLDHLLWSIFLLFLHIILQISWVAFEGSFHVISYRLGTCHKPPKGSSVLLLWISNKGVSPLRTIDMPY